VDAGKAEQWLEKLEGDITLMEGWPRHEVRLTRSGALVVKFSSPNLGSIRREAQRLREIGLVEGNHLTMKMPEEAATATSRSLGGVLSTPRGFPYMAPTNSGDLRRSL
jgi:hypothetical protein